MEIWNDEKILGESVTKVAKLLKTSDDALIDEHDVMDILNYDHAKAKELLTKLESHGYVEHDRSVGGWRNTIREIVLVRSEIKRPISIAEANKKIEEVQKRIIDVNNDPYYMHSIATVNVFGDYLEDKVAIKLLKFVVELIQREKDHDKFIRQLHDRELRKPKDFWNYSQYLYYPEEEVMNKLKSGTHNTRFVNSTLIKYLYPNGKYQSKEIFRGDFSVNP